MKAASWIETRPSQNSNIMNGYEPPIFVVGLPRSGSTLLELAIARSPGVLRLAETLFLSPWRRDFRYFLRKRVGDISKDENLKKMVEILFSDRGEIPGLTGSFWRLARVKAINDEAFKQKIFHSLQSSDRSLGSIFRILLKDLTEFNGCRRCCVPFPVHVHHLPTLKDWFPDAKIVHITRDPRAIAVSKTNDPGGTALYNERFPYLRPLIRKAMMAFVVVQYIDASRVSVKFQNYPNYLLVRYEDFVLRPVETMKNICKFAGIEYVDGMLESADDRAQRSSITGELRTKPEAKAASKWMETITPFEKFMVTALTRRSMARFGFDYQSHPVYEREIYSSKAGTQT